MLHVRYITEKELKSNPNYFELEEAISFPYTHTKKCAPFTKTGYISVAAIYNMNAWASWKSSSLGRRERAKADVINDVPLYKLMELNTDRRSNLPALFPTANTGIAIPIKIKDRLLE